MVLTPQHYKDVTQPDLDGNIWNTFSFQKCEVVSLRSSKQTYWSARVEETRVLLCEIPNTWEDNGNNGQGMGKYQDVSLQLWDQKGSRKPEVISDGQYQ